MKIALYITGILLIIAGVIFFLQGINILPGSFMSGQLQWAINGAIAIGVGAFMTFLVRRGK